MFKNGFLKETLKRSKNGGNNFGHLFLTIMFCMMCCSGFLSSSTKSNLQKQFTRSVELGKQLKAEVVKPEIVVSPFSEDQVCQAMLEENALDYVVHVAEKNQPKLGLLETLLQGDYKYTKDVLTSGSVFGTWVTGSLYKANSVLFPMKGYRKKRAYVKRKGQIVEEEESMHLDT
jgi:hypothetical protein